VEGGEVNLYREVGGKATDVRSQFFDDTDLTRHATQDIVEYDRSMATMATTSLSDRIGTNWMYW